MATPRIRSAQTFAAVSGRTVDAQGAGSPGEEPDGVGALSGGIRGLGLLGVPTSAGSHNAGQDKAPDAWRAAGLARRLAAHGLAVRDFGDLPVQVHRPAEPEAGVRDLARVAQIAADTARLSPGSPKRAGRRWSWAGTARSRWAWSPG